MRYADYADRIREHASVAEVAEYGRVMEGGREYPLLRLTVPGSRWLVITSGFHGEEPSGPLTLAESFGEIAAHARARGVGLRIYPCINPSGFEDGTRYNRSGEKPNNDFLRYELSPGVWGDLPRGQGDFLRWKLHDGGPKETRAVRTDAARFPPPDAALDIHQDHYLPMEAAYAYTFGDRAAYRPLMEATSAHVTVLRNRQVDEETFTDEDGFIVHHDGSVTDWYMRQGVPYTAALETTTRTPMRTSHAVNLLWIHGFIELAARGDAQTR